MRDGGERREMPDGKGLRIRRVERFLRIGRRQHSLYGRHCPDCHWRVRNPPQPAAAAGLAAGAVGEFESAPDHTPVAKSDGSPYAAITRTMPHSAPSQSTTKAVKDRPNAGPRLAGSA